MITIWVDFGMHLASHLLRYVITNLPCTNTDGRHPGGALKPTLFLTLFVN